MILNLILEEMPGPGISFWIYSLKRFIISPAITLLEELM